MKLKVFSIFLLLLLSNCGLFKESFLQIDRKVKMKAKLRLKGDTKMLKDHDLEYEAKCTVKQGVLNYVTKIETHGIF